MNSTIETISPLRQRFLDEMRMRKLSPKAQSGYIRTMSRFYGWLGHSPDTATVEGLRRYQRHLVDHGISPISLNVTITGLKFFFDSTLDRPELMRHMHPVHTPRKIPVVLSPEEVALLIGAAGSLRNQTALSFAYGAGLRVSEVVALKGKRATNYSLFSSPFRWLNPWHANSTATALQILPAFWRRAGHA